MSLQLTKTVHAERDRAETLDKAAPRVALTTSGGALACAACCVLPIAFPAIALAAGGAVLVWFGVFTKVMFVVGLLSVGTAWGWIIYRARSSRSRIARPTLVMMGLATAALAVGLAWPLIEPSLLKLLQG
jgi:hypothetical protein